MSGRNRLQEVNRTVTLLFVASFLAYADFQVCTKLKRQMLQLNQTTMSALLDLPDDVSKSIILEWIDGEHWSLLDMALCNKKLRKVYLSCVETISCGFLIPLNDRNDGGWNDFKDIYEWVYAREIQLTEIDLNDKMLLRSPHVNLNTLPIRYEYVRHIRADRVNQDCSTVSRFINRCTNLTHLTFDAYYVELQNIDSTIVRGLTNLEIHSVSFARTNASYCIESLTYAKEHCQNLRSLLYGLKCSPESNATLLECFRVNPNITDLDLHVDAEVLEGILQSYSKSLKKLNIICELDVSIVADFCANCSVLNYFCVKRPPSSVGTSRCEFQKDISLLRVSILDKDPTTWVEIWSKLDRVETLKLSTPGLLIEPSTMLLFDKFGRTLKSLDLYLDEVGSESTVVALRKCPLLKTLVLSSYNGLDWAVVFSAPLGVSRIKTRSYVSSSDILLILSKCPHLKYGEFPNVSTFQAKSEERQAAIAEIKTAFKEYRNVEGSNTWFKAGDGTGHWVINIESIYF